MDEKKCAIVIPARMHSTRLPNKPLINIAGKPLLSWVIDVALKVEFKSEIIVAPVVVIPDIDSNNESTKLNPKK